MIRDPLLLLAFMFAVVAFTRYLEKRFHIVERVSSAVVCTLLGIALANTGVIPHTSPTHAAVFDIAIPYAIVLVIIGTDMKELARAGRPILIAYGLAVLGSFVGGLASGVALNAWVGAETWKLSGAFSGAFAGGGMNFAAVGQGLEISSSTFAAAAVADNLSTVPYLLAQVALVGVLGTVFMRRARGGRSATPSDTVSPAGDPDGAAHVTDVRKQWTTTETSITELSILGGLPLAALWLARALGNALPQIPEVLWLTTIALVLAQLPFMRRLRGAQVVSYFALHVFFIVLGAASVIADVLEAGVPIFGFMIAVIVVHAAIAYGLGWLTRLDLPTVSVASQAAIGGPGSALALSMAMKWDRLVTPGVIVGIFGYALGNYLGFGCAYLVRLWTS
jgi:uncharacterized membrane protein